MGPLGLGPLKLGLLAQWDRCYQMPRCLQLPLLDPSALSAQWGRWDPSAPYYRLPPSRQLGQSDPLAQLPRWVQLGRYFLTPLSRPLDLWARWDRWDRCYLKHPFRLSDRLALSGR